MVKRKALIEERYYGIKRRQMGVFQKILDKVSSKMKTSVAGFLPNDLVFMIFLLLPVKTLLRFQCVCKSWNKMINCAEFVEAYNQVVQIGTIFRRPVEGDRMNTFHVESQANMLEKFSIFPFSLAEIKKSEAIKLLEIKDGMSKVTDLNISCFGSIVATCKGLILIKSMFEKQLKTKPRIPGYRELGSYDRPGRLILMNPMTKKIYGFPLGTLPCVYSKNESYGIVFSHSQRVYKVVHLLKDELDHIACEVWSMETRSWKAIDGPPEMLCRQFSRVPISASGALHWVTGHRHTDYIVSMDAEDEKFFTIDLPKPLGKHSKLIEMGGFLTLVTTLVEGSVDVWVLKGLEGTEWIKQHTIRLDSIVGYDESPDIERSLFNPIFAVSAKEMIFKQYNRFYSYDFELKRGREIEMTGGLGDSLAHEPVMPHSNTLATWEPLEPL